MSMDEIRVRGWQEVAKRWDAALCRAGIGIGAGGQCASGQPLGCFLFRESDLPTLISIWREHLPQEAEETVRQAETICRHQFDLLGYQQLEYGPRIDWHLDIVHGKRAPSKPWFKIHYLDFEEVGDAKITWELNRHQHLVTLAKAYCLTREKRFAEEVFRQWYDWHEKNPYPIGINWASSLEVSFRSLSWLWVERLLPGCPVTPSHFRADLLRSLEIHGRHIERYLSTYFSPNTHLLGEGVGLFFIGTLWRQLRAAKRWQRRGWEIVLQESVRQVQADGMHFEQSTYYHVYALDFFLHARMLAVANEIPIPRSFDHTLEKMLEALNRISQSGIAPSLGDDDGGRLFDPRRNQTQHLLDPLCTGAGLYQRSDFHPTGNFCEEAIWLLGQDGIARLKNLSPTKSVRVPVNARASGIYSMGGEEPSHPQVIIKAGAQGAGRGGHGHADALSLTLAANGRPWLIDPGTFAYVSDANERDIFRQTAAHNTLQVDGKSQAEPTEAFAWECMPKVQVEKCVEGECFKLLIASHDGYDRLPQPIVHRRCLFHLKSQYWLVLDLAEGEGSHSLALSWHLAPDCVALPTSPKCVHFEAKDGSSLGLLTAEGEDWAGQIGNGWWSPAYGRKELAPVLTFQKETQLPAEFATLLRPSVNIPREWGKLTKIKTELGSRRVSGYLYRTADECHYIFFAHGKGGRWVAGPWASDASFLFISLGPQGRLRQVALCEGSFVEKEAIPVLAARQLVDSWDWSEQHGAGARSCSERDAIDFLPIGSEASLEVMSTGTATSNRRQEDA